MSSSSANFDAYIPVRVPEGPRPDGYVSVYLPDGTGFVVNSRHLVRLDADQMRYCVRISPDL